MISIDAAQEGGRSRINRPAITAGDLESILESILFVSGEPVSVVRIAAVLGIDRFEAEAAASRLRERYAAEKRGIRLVRMDDTLQLCSAPEYSEYIRLVLEARKPPQLSPPALEVLAVIAYFQPVTKAYVEEVRGVDSAYTIGLLADRNLIEPCGRLAAPGRPIIYRTTPAFLRVFGISTLEELPQLPQTAGDDSEAAGIRKAIEELRVKN